MSFAQGTILTRLLCHGQADDPFLNLSAPTVCDELGSQWQFGSAALWVSSFSEVLANLLSPARFLSKRAATRERLRVQLAAGDTNPLRDLPADRSAAPSD